MTRRRRRERTKTVKARKRHQRELARQESMAWLRAWFRRVKSSFYRIRERTVREILGLTVTITSFLGSPHELIASR